MVRHVVLYKLKAGESAEKLVERFLSMRGQVPHLLSIEAGADFLHSPRSYDVALVTTFESREAMAAYREHPFHKGVSSYVHSVIESSASVDFEF